MSLMYVGIPRCSFLFYFPIKIKVQRGFFFCKAEINSKRREITKMKCISLAGHSCISLAERYRVRGERFLSLAFYTKKFLIFYCVTTRIDSKLDSALSVISCL